MDYLSYCSKCPVLVHCCINPPKDGFVAVGIKDAEKIKKETGKPFHEFLDFSMLSDEMVKDCREDFEGSEGKLRASMFVDNRILRLKVKSNNECIFLDSEKKCSIYHLRPSICSMYPYWCKKEKKKAEETEEQMILIRHDKDPECAVSINNPPALNFPEPEKSNLIKVAKKIEEESEYYKKHIKEFSEKNNLLL